MTPKTTLSGTTRATMSSDRLIADIAAGVETDAMKAPTPGAKARHRMRPIGTAMRMTR